MGVVNATRQAEDQEDLDLVAAVRMGNDRAFEALYARYRSRIAGYVQGMVGDWARAEDVTQEVFISALRRMRQTERPIAFRPWLFEIAKNACIDQFRRSQRGEEVPWETDDGKGLHVVDGRGSGATPRTPESAVESSEQLEHLRGALGALSDSHHEILVLRELEGLSYREIGERMGLSRPGVESTLFRARRRLSEEYDELSTGRSCARMQILLAAAEPGRMGVRERRRLARHVSWCKPCRRQARLVGVEGLGPAGAAAKIAAFLPLPVVDLLRRLRGGDGGGALHGLVASGSLVHLDTGWAKAATVVVAVATAGAGAGVVREVSRGPDRPSPAPAAARSATPPSGPARHGAASSGSPAPRSTARRVRPGGARPAQRSQAQARPRPARSEKHSSSPPRQSGGRGAVGRPPGESPVRPPAENGPAGGGAAVSPSPPPGPLHLPPLSVTVPGLPTIPLSDPTQLLAGVQTALRDTVGGLLHGGS